MAGHSKWANIKHRKGRQDAKRGGEEEARRCGCKLDGGKRVTLAGLDFKLI